MRIAITGASGLIGTELVSSLQGEVVKISRQNAAWNPENKNFNPDFFKNLDVVIHLAGEGVANKLWSKKQKDLLHKSRIDTSLFLSEILASSPPKVLISASGVGFYGSRSDEILDESGTKGQGFLSDLSRDWEAAADRIKATRTVKLRLGMVVTSKGGALKKMLPAFKLGVGGKLGSGKQYISWISLEDAIRAIQFCIANESIEGAVNLCSPNPETNANFSKQLAAALQKPCLFPVPAFVLKLILGEMGEELLLSSTRAVPKKLLEHGFKFKHETLKQAFDATL